MRTAIPKNINTALQGRNTVGTDVMNGLVDATARLNLGPDLSLSHPFPRTADVVVAVVLHVRVLCLETAASML
jgi:hypothetical protein